MSGKTKSKQLWPGLWTYEQTGRSPNRYARVCKGGKTFTRTTGTSDHRLADKRAEEFFGDCMMTLRSEASRIAVATAIARRFDKIADDWLEGKQGHICDREWRNLQNILTAASGPARFFGRMDVGEITTDKLRQYLQAAEANSTTGKLSPHTLKRHLSVISGVLRLAAERQLIPAVPPMPKVKIKDQPRSWFTPEEYLTLLHAARRLAAEAQSKGSADAP